MPTEECLDPRLASAVPYILPGARVADVGTDHAYLPIYLVKEGYAAFAVASDINRGPLGSAKENIAAAGLSDRIPTLLCDGLAKLEPFSPDHILIFGMGGELIIRILSEAPWVKDPKIRLVLQPMSRAHLLRAWLNENGFTVIGESLSESGKIYQTVCAEYTGKSEEYTPEDCLLGKRNIEEAGPLFSRFVEHEIRVLEEVVNGKAKSKSSDSAREEEMLCVLRKRKESLR